MCGIAGVWNLHGEPASGAVVERMLDRIAHRGPDDRGVWAGGPAALGLARLSILDLTPQGHQPFVTPDGLGVIAYNGEVYNFRALRRELEAEGLRFHSGTDTEVVLHALHRWGPERAVPRFNGMFAFAYHDRRSGRLWLGRDRLGIKPLYLARSPRALVFASEIKALFGHPDIQPRPDLHALTTQVLFSRLDGTWTPFERIEAVLPGTLMRFGAGDEAVITYFDVLRDVDPARVAAAESVGEDEWLRKMDELFTAGVRDHLISDAPLAATCSGGLDCSYVVAAARAHKPDIVAYVADIRGVESEAPKARRVCRHVGIQLREVPVDRGDFFRLWPRAVAANDQPNYFPQNIPVMAIAEAARADGFKVLLSGEGSDELFGGYPSYKEAYHMWRLRRLHARWIPNNRLWRAVGRYVGKLAPMDLEQLAARPFTHANPWTASGLDGPRMVGVDAAKRYLRQQALFKKLEPLKRLEDRAFLARTFEDIYTHLATALTSEDKMGMSQSIEMRFPFLTNELIDFALHLPRRMKYDGRQGKRLVKRAAERWLPREIVYAPKIGFGIKKYSWKGTELLLRDGRVRELLKWNRQDWPVLRRMLWDERLLVYHLVSMELWMRIYFDGQTPDQLTEALLRLADAPDDQ